VLVEVEQEVALTALVQALVVLAVAETVADLERQEIQTLVAVAVAVAVMVLKLETVVLVLLFFAIQVH
jgi:hypothetical protein